MIRRNENCLSCGTVTIQKKDDVPTQNWKLAINRFMIEFEEQLTPYLYGSLHRIIYRLNILHRELIIK